MLTCLIRSELVDQWREKWAPEIRAGTMPALQDYEMPGPGWAAEAGLFLLKTSHPEPPHFIVPAQ